MTIFNRTHLLALAIVFSLVALPALAQEAKETQTSGSVTVGAQTGTGLNTSSKLQEYETVPTGVSLFDVDFDWKNASKYFMTFEGNKLGLDDQSGGVPGRPEGRLDVQRVARSEPPLVLEHGRDALHPVDCPACSPCPTAC